MYVILIWKGSTILELCNYFFGNWIECKLVMINQMENKNKFKNIKFTMHKLTSISLIQ